MKTVSQQIAELSRESGININGVLYVSYTQFMWYLGQSTHANQLVKKQERYPAHFIEIDGKPYVTKRYAKYILQHQALLAGSERLKADVSICAQHDRKGGTAL